MTSFAGGAAQAGYVARIRDLVPQRCLVVPVDVGKHSAMALVADHYGQIVGEPFEFSLTVSGVDRFLAAVAAVERQTAAASVASAENHFRPARGPVCHHDEFPVDVPGWSNR